MLLAVLAIGGAILTASTIAGLLTLYQIRQATDFGNSAKAIFAADAGLEWELFNVFYPSGDAPKPDFTNGADFRGSCTDDEENSLPCTDASATIMKSIGDAVSIKRGFILFLENATATVP